MDVANERDGASLGLAWAPFDARGSRAARANVAQARVDASAR